jgi:uncharacterized protein YkwD
MVAAILISIGLVISLFSPAFTARSNKSAAPNLPGVLQNPSAATTNGPQQPAVPVPSDATSAEPSQSPAASQGQAIAGNVEVENAVVALVNAERRHAKCDPVQVDQRLRTAARVHSADMATHRFLNHRGSDGSSPEDRMRAAGFDDPQSEDVARGFASARDVVRAWLHSSKDRRNIDDCDAQSIGVGVAISSDGTPFWTQDFGK